MDCQSAAGTISLMGLYVQQLGSIPNGADGLLVNVLLFLHCICNKADDYVARLIIKHA